MAKINTQTNKRYEFIEQMFDKLEQIPINEIVGDHLPLVRKGAHYMGLCPFHKDTHIGSFVVSPNTGIWKCFACGDGYAGNGVKFEMLYENIGYLDAAFEVAKRHGVITFDEYQTYSNSNYDKKYVNQLRQKHEAENKKKCTSFNRANALIIHNVYQAMKNASTLSKEHMDALKYERKLSDERIAQDYFTFPVQIKAKIIAKIRKQYPEYSDDILKTVPGFFIDKKTGSLSFAGYRGLGILIRNPEGFIEGIQIRKDTIQAGDNRYTWFSSTFAAYDQEKYDGGCGCNSPKDILYAPEDKRKHILCITEGRFKSEKLAEFGNTSISVQGVTSWRGIDVSIASICKKQNIQKIFLFFDSDILGKHALFEQAQKLVHMLQEKFPDISVYYATWEKRLGKGIDDCIIAGNLSKVMYFSPSIMERIVAQIFKETLSKFNVSSLRELPDNDAEAFVSALQGLSEQKLREESEKEETCYEN